MAIVAQIQGGLGNQLFIYALGRQLSIKNGADLKLDIISGYLQDKFGRSFLLDRFNIASAIADNLESYSYWGGRLVRSVSSIVNSCIPLRARSILKESGRRYLSGYSETSRKSLYLIGYWQSYKYFSDILPQLRRDITLRAPLDVESGSIESEIVDSESVAVHVRQDNLSYRLSLDYYSKAAAIIASKISSPKFYVFGDSADFADKVAKILPGKAVASSRDCCRDLWLMRRCRHHIIANSTFSWWGAYLSDTSADKIVVAPASIRKFNEDIIPQGWNVINA